MDKYLKFISHIFSFQKLVHGKSFGKHSKILEIKNTILPKPKIKKNVKMYKLFISNGFKNDLTFSSHGAGKCVQRCTRITRQIIDIQVA